MEAMKRTADCGSLRKNDAGRTVILNGWVHRKRNHGGIFFINLRDRYGITQVTVDTEKDASLAAVCDELRNEYVIAAEGTVSARPDDMVNPSMETGEIEIAASRIVILNKCEVLPFQVDEESKANEELRLKYRYLDLRSAAMQKTMRMRSQTTFAIREWMTSNGFYEIETPTFIKSTPEGARDYLVPSRLYPGKFYALPQSPQLYKQILMVAGFDKYFQIARCYRDEDSRGDRQPEFTQIDVEMSFVERDDVLTMTEGMMRHVFKKVLNIDLPQKFRRLTWEEAMENYGSDKPDLRFDMQLKDFSQFVEGSEFAAFKDALSQGGKVKALVVKGKANYSRKQIEELEAHAKIYKARGLAWMKVSTGNVLEGGVSKFFADKAAQITGSLGAEEGDLILIVADAKKEIVNIALGAVRSKLGRDLGLCDSNSFEFAWIVDFPMFEYDEELKKWEAAHHLFTWPQNQYHDTMESDPGSVKGDLYDLVLNGYELASGSIRIHDPQMQERVFKIVGIEPAEAEKKFGFLTEAFKYGAPPHGGIAPGLDRLVMIMAGLSSLKDVIAFPKNSFAVSPMDDCPSEVDQKQLDELKIIIQKEKE
uniref:Aspartate--tRNA(Asp/Asn) ligase n=1 Tax=uncultured bacterium contig00060 TaxID=1181543 RepID=A0A806K0K0_9BACT|nr:aspartyl-tRNA synthetase [uncultured bacterium contig00060]